MKFALDLKLRYKKLFRFVTRALAKDMQYIGCIEKAMKKLLLEGDYAWIMRSFLTYYDDCLKVGSNDADEVDVKYMKVICEIFVENYDFQKKLKMMLELRLVRKLSKGIAVEKRMLHAMATVYADTFRTLKDFENALAGRFEENNFDAVKLDTHNWEAENDVEVLLPPEFTTFLAVAEDKWNESEEMNPELLVELDGYVAKQTFTWSHTLSNCEISMICPDSGTS